MKNKKFKKFFFILIPILALIFCSFNAGNFHTSITKVEYMPSNKTLKLSSKINALDLEKVLGKKSGASGFSTSLSKYLQQNIKISINDDPVNFSYSSVNPDGNVIWVYYEVANVDSNISSITIKNTLLINSFPDQQNFINFLINGKRKSLVCKKDSEVGRINF